jgi:hypothetical protein
MSVETIIQSIDQEIASLTQARQALAGASGRGGVTRITSGIRTFTAAARRKMAAAQKRRWAAYRAAKKKAA